MARAEAPTATSHLLTPFPGPAWQKMRVFESHSHFLSESTSRKVIAGGPLTPFPALSLAKHEGGRGPLTLLPKMNFKESDIPRSTYTRPIVPLSRRRTWEDYSHLLPKRVPKKTYPSVHSHLSHSLIRQKLRVHEKTPTSSQNGLQGNPLSIVHSHISYDSTRPKARCMRTTHTSSLVRFRKS